MSNSLFKKKFNKNLCVFKKYNMTILVTGTSGFIGSNLIRYLIKSKKKFFGIDKIKILILILKILLRLICKIKVE